MNDKSQNLFTELRFKKSDEVHDSGFACIECDWKRIIAD